MEKDEDIINIYSQVLGIDDILTNTIFTLKFKNEKLEEELQEKLMKDFKCVRLSVNLFSLVLIFLRVFDFEERKKLNPIYFYTQVGVVAFLILFFIFYQIFIKKPQIVKKFEYAFVLMILLINAVTANLVEYFQTLNVDAEQVRVLYLMLFISFFQILFLYESNFYFSLLVFVLNLSTSIHIFVVKIDKNVNGYRDIIAALCISIFSYFLKRYQSNVLRINFLQNYKLSKFFTYCSGLIKNMNGLHVTFKNQKILVFNNVFKKCIKESSIIKNIFLNKNTNNNDSDFINNYDYKKFEEEMNQGSETDRDLNFRGTGYIYRNVERDDSLAKINLSQKIFDFLLKNKTKIIEENKEILERNAKDLLERLEAKNQKQKIRAANKAEKAKKFLVEEKNRILENAEEQEESPEEEEEIGSKDRSINHHRDLNSSLGGEKEDNIPNIFSAYKIDDIINNNKEKNQNIKIVNKNYRGSNNNNSNNGDSNNYSLNRSNNNNSNAKALSANKKENSNNVQVSLSNRSKEYVVKTSAGDEEKFKSHQLNENPNDININNINNYVNDCDQANMKFTKMINLNTQINISIVNEEKDYFKAKDAEYSKKLGNERETRLAVSPKPNNNSVGNSNIITKNNNVNLNLSDRRPNQLMTKMKFNQTKSNKDKQDENYNFTVSEKNDKAQSSSIYTSKDLEFLQFIYENKELNEYSTQMIFTEMINEICELYLRNLKLKSMSDEFTNYKAENLYDIFKNLISSYQQDKENENFKYLGFFYSEEDRKYFQIYFRKNSEFSNLIDFLIYDFTKIKEAEDMEFYLKSKFFAKIAHEFKTPINSIIVLIKKLYSQLEKKRANVSEGALSLISQIENFSNYVIFLINDVIEYSAMYSTRMFKKDRKLKNKENSNKSNKNNKNEKEFENDKQKGLGNLTNYNKNNKDERSSRKHLGRNTNTEPDEVSDDDKRLKINVEPVHLDQTFTFCRDILNTLLIYKGKERYIKLNFEIDKGLKDFFVYTDEFRLKQILSNFISNAVKFTKSGHITIKASLVRDHSELFMHNFSYTNVKISVNDSGIGIKKKILKELNNLSFSEKNNDFFSSSKNNGYQGGSGLGLYISKFIAERLDHRLEIQSTYGKGSCFSVILKAEKVQVKNSEKLLNQGENYFTGENFNFSCKNIEKFKFTNAYNNNLKNERQSNLLKCFSENDLIRTKNVVKEELEVINRKNVSEHDEKNKSMNNNDLSFKYKRKLSSDEDIGLFNKKQSCDRNDIYNVKDNENDDPIDNLNYLIGNHSSQANDNCNINSNNLIDEVSKRYKKVNLNDPGNAISSRQDMFMKIPQKTLSVTNQFSEQIVFDSDKQYNKNSLNNKQIGFNSNFNSRENKIEDESKSKITKYISSPGLYIKNQLLYDSSSILSQLNLEQQHEIGFTITNNLKPFKEKNNIHKTEFNHTNINLTNNNLINVNEQNSKKYLNNNSRNKMISDLNSLTHSNSDNVYDDKKVILIVDDHKYVREAMSNIIKKILRRNNLENSFSVKEASDGCDIIHCVIKDQMENNKIKCIITDENMEFINGSDAIKILKGLEKNNKIKPMIIASYSAFEDEISRKIIKSSGVDYFLSKPCTENKLNKFFEEFKILESDNNNYREDQYKSK